MRFRIDLKIFIFLILFVLTRQINIYAITILFCFIHECGHLIAGLILGLKPDKLELMPFGVSISFKLKIEDYNTKIGNANLLELKKIFIAIAGPLTNLVFILILKNPICIYANILILLFNLIPIYPLDGGRILKSIINIISNRKYSKMYSNLISNITIIILTIISSIGVLLFENISIFLIDIFLWYLVLKENKKYKLEMRVYEMIDK